MRPRALAQFLLPQLALCTVFVLIPLAAIVILSFYDWSLLGGHRFIGLGNYAELLDDRQFWRALVNTFLFALFVVPSTMAAGLVLALGLNAPLPGRNAIRAAIYMPVVISSVASGVIAIWILDDQYGLLNALLGALGGPRLPWLTSTRLAMPMVITTKIWLRTGLCMVVYLAALGDVPRDQMEAASLDGAGAWQRFRFIVWPVLLPATAFLLITNLIDSLHIFDLVYIMTEGGPAGSTSVLVGYLYQAAFGQDRQGYGAAIGVVLLALLSGLTALLLRRRRP